MRIPKQKALLLFILITLLLLGSAKIFKIKSNYINIVIGSILFCTLVYEIITEISENYEDKEENPIVLALYDKIKIVHPMIPKVVKNSGIKFFGGKNVKKSYTINKKYIFICLYDEHGNIYPENQLIHVLLHEIAHSVCDEIGHTEKFNQILDIFLIEAEKNGLYDPKIPAIVDYCQYSDE